MKFYAVLVALLATSPMVRGGGCATAFRYSAPTTYSSTSYVSYAKSYDYVAPIQFVIPTLALYSAPPAYGALYYPPASFYGQGAGVGGVGGAAIGEHAKGTTDPCAETKKQLSDLKDRFSRLEGFLEGRGSFSPRGGAAPPMDRADGGNGGGGNGGAGAGGAGEQRPLARLQLLTQHCAGCHTAATAPTLGKGFVMFAPDGSLAKVDPVKTGEILRRTAMPDGQSEAMPRGRSVGAAVKLSLINEYIAAQQ